MVDGVRVQHSQSAGGEKKSRANTGEGPGFEEHLQEAQRDLRRNRNTDPVSVPDCPYTFFSSFCSQPVYGTNQVTGDRIEHSLSGQAGSSETTDQHRVTEQGADSHSYQCCRAALNRMDGSAGDDQLIASLLSPIIPQFTLALPQSALNVERVAQDVARYMNSLGKSFDTVKLSLSPEGLGSVNLTIKIVDGKVNISIAVESAHKHFFEQNSEQLIKALQEQNIAVGELSVSVDERRDGREWNVIRPQQGRNGADHAETGWTTVQWMKRYDVFFLKGKYVVDQVI